MDTPNADPAPSRKFSLGDAMLLMASLALTLVLLRASHWFERLVFYAAEWWKILLALTHRGPWEWPHSTRSGLYLIAAQTVDELLIVLLSSVLLGLTLVQPILRWRRPQPPFREIVRQSGLVICLGVIIATLVMADLLWIAGIDLMGPAFLAASFVLLLWPLLGIRPWQYEASWVDRLGRAVGWGWMVVIVAGTAARWLFDHT